jgi:hypothetical protein
MEVFRPEDSVGRNLGAPLIGFPQKFAAPDFSRVVDTPPRCVSKLARPDDNAGRCKPARMAQIRRDYDRW